MIGCKFEDRNIKNLFREVGCEKGSFEKLVSFGMVIIQINLFLVMDQNCKLLFEVFL